MAAAWFGKAQPKTAAPKVGKGSKVAAEEKAVAGCKPLSTWFQNTERFYGVCKKHKLPLSLVQAQGKMRGNLDDAIICDDKDKDLIEMKHDISNSNLLVKSPLHGHGNSARRCEGGSKRGRETQGDGSDSVSFSSSGGWGSKSAVIGCNRAASGGGIGGWSRQQQLAQSRGVDEPWACPRLGGLEDEEWHGGGSHDGTRGGEDAKKKWKSMNHKALMMGLQPGNASANLLPSAASGNSLEREFGISPKATSITARSRAGQDAHQGGGNNQESRSIISGHVEIEIGSSPSPPGSRTNDAKTLNTDGWRKVNRGGRMQTAYFVKGRPLTGKQAWARSKASKKSKAT